LFCRIDYHEFAKDMNLDGQLVASEAVTDARFDGKFFISVVGSGFTAARSVPAPTAKEKNVRYFPLPPPLLKRVFAPVCVPSGNARPELRPGQERKAQFRELCG